MNSLTLTPLFPDDCTVISKAFKSQGWNKPIQLYQQYLMYQEAGARDIIVARLKNEFAGYLTVNWRSDYSPFAAQNIPEIVDFNVLKKFQRMGIGTQLMEEAEKRIKQISAFAGIGFGIYKDYGPAQILYIKRGYIPDGNGLVKDFQVVTPGETHRVDDSLVLYLLKKL